VSWKNEYLSAQLYKQATKPSIWDELPPGPPLSRWVRVKLWIADHMPRVHLGPCPQDEWEGW
jgi:hypothetical protein